MYALRFLQCYIEKVLTDSGLIDVFNDFFENQDLCYLLYRIVQDKAELVKKIVANTKLENTTMLQWFLSKNIPYAVGRECMRWQKSDRIRFSEDYDALKEEVARWELCHPLG